MKSTDENYSYLAYKALFIILLDYSSVYAICL